MLVLGLERRVGCLEAVLQLLFVDQLGVIVKEKLECGCRRSPLVL